MRSSQCEANTAGSKAVRFHRRISVRKVVVTRHDLHTTGRVVAEAGLASARAAACGISPWPKNTARRGEDRSQDRGRLCRSWLQFHIRKRMERITTR